MIQKRGNRWYDAYPRLADVLDDLKQIPKKKRISICSDLKDLIAQKAPRLIDKTVMEYPLSVKRRWYDDDPISWMAINALRYTDDTLIHQATELLSNKISLVSQTQN